ncbi:MAG: sensor histidine kinase [Bacteroidetes bacterium]|nr:MAG: sensor histidine kinase [Bacteroidota bacterium]
MNSIYKYILFLCITLFVWVIGFSQNSVIDSLTNELSIHQQKDTGRVKLLNTVAFKNYGLDQAKLRKYAEEAVTLAQEIDYPKGEARSWYLLSIFHLSKGGLDSAMTTINKSLNLYTKIDNLIGVSSCYDLIGTISRFQEDFEKSVSYYNKALKIVKDKGDHMKAAGFIGNIGAVYSTMGEYDKAVTSYMEAIVIFDSLKAKKKSLNPLNNIALTYARQGRNTEALAYFQKCLSGYRENGNKIFGASILLNIGLVYSNINEYDKALLHIKEALEISKELGNELEVAKCFTSIGSAFFSKNEYDTALSYFNKSLEISDRLGSKEGRYNSYTNIGNLHLERAELNLALQNFKKSVEVSTSSGSKRLIGNSHIALGATYYELENYNKAFDNVSKGIKIAEELSLVNSQKKANLVLSKIYEKQGNYIKALEKYKLHKSQSDSLLNRESIETITQLEFEYKYQQERDSAKMRELMLINTVKSTSQNLEQSQRNSFIAIIVFLLITMLLGGIIFFLKLRNQKSKNQKIVIEQKLLRSQMTPHFIFNSLSVLQGMILNKEERSITYLSKFSKLLRATLENSRYKTVTLSKELSAIDSYMALQNLDVSTPYNYHLSLDSTINSDTLKIPPMLIQPFIENATEHAFVDKKENKEISVQITFEQEKLVVTIADNGIGINTDLQKSSNTKKSLATAITSERLEMISKDFKMKGSLSIQNRESFGEQGTLVTLVIPYKINLVQ